MPPCTSDLDDENVALAAQSMRQLGAIQLQRHEPPDRSAPDSLL
jgi:hypothetical protein